MSNWALDILLRVVTLKMNGEELRQAKRFAQDIYSRVDDTDRIYEVSAYLLFKTDMLIPTDTRILPAFTCRDIPALLDLLTRFVVSDITAIPVILAANAQLIVCCPSSTCGSPSRLPTVARHVARQVISNLWLDMYTPTSSSRVPLCSS